jgi:hypothetical protein
MRLALIAAAVAVAGPALAADGQTLSVTIYNDNQALVQDVRALDIPAGRQRLELKDVSNQIQAQTVSLTAPDVAIVEQNFDFDLLTPTKLMEKAVGKTVQIVRTNPGNGQEITETATVLSANEGVVLKIGDRIEVLRDDGAPTRVIFDGVPENLRARPTLSVTVDSARAGRRDATLTYLTGGLRWRADYVAVLDDAAGKMDFQGWITLINLTATTFTDAQTDLVAGGVGGQFARGVQRAGTEESDAQRLGDSYIYPLRERTTIAANQQKQVGFVEATGVAARKAYEYQTDGFGSADAPQHVPSVLKFSNDRATGLGAPLPAGSVRVYMRDASKALKFIGANDIGHTPQGSDLSLPLGDAFDVTVQPTQLSQSIVDKHRTRHEMSYLLRNAGTRPVTVRLRQSDPAGDSDIKAIKESLAGRKIDARTLEWNVSVPAGGQTEVTASIEESR